MAKTRQQSLVSLLFFGDLFFVVLAFYIAHLLRFSVSHNILVMFPVQTGILTAVMLLSFFIFELYGRDLKFRNTSYVSRLIVAIVFASIGNALASYFLPSFKVGRGLVLMTALLVLLFAFVWRICFDVIFLKNIKPKSILILGAGAAGRYICDVMQQNRNYNLIGFIDDDAKKHGMMLHEHLVLGGTDKLESIVREHGVEEIIVAITHEKSPELLRNLLDVKLRGVVIHDLPSIYEALTGKLPVSHLRAGWIVFASFQAMEGSKAIFLRFKRLTDILVSALGLVLSFPICVLSAILIKLESRGPVFFSQKRIGLRDSIFTIYKFRSMVTDAEKDGAVFAKFEDTRITRVGALLRKSRIDEIPQLWNILRGDMSFVGPRPERPEFVEVFKKKIPYYSLRHIVKPGLTGWAQVNFRYGADEADALEKLQYDMYYLKNLSFMLDIQTFLKTINVVLLRRLGR